MEAQMPDFSVNFLGAGMPDFFWGGGMWIFPLGMIIVMLVMAFLMCGRGARPFCGHVAYGGRHGDPREDPLEILKRRYARGEIAKDEFVPDPLERIRNPFRETIARMEVTMETQTPDFSVNVLGVKGFCPTGEVYAKQQIAAQRTPVLSCEGACIRGEIARLAANLISREIPSLARACHAETFFVPHSAMTSWVKGAEKVVMIDGCFLKCHGRTLKTMIPEGKVVHIDALPLYKKYTDVFLMDDVPEEERKSVAREVADKIIAALNQAGEAPGTSQGTESGAPAT